MNPGALSATRGSTGRCPWHRQQTLPTQSQHATSGSMLSGCSPLAGNAGYSQGHHHQRSGSNLPGSQLLAGDAGCSQMGQQVYPSPFKPTRADACKRNPSNEQPNSIRSLARAWALWILVPFQQLGGPRDGVHDTDSKPCRPNHNTQPPARCYLAAARLPGTQSTATGQPSPLSTTFQAFPHHLWGSLAGALLGFLYRASSPRGLYAVPSREFVPQRSLKYWFWNLWFWISVLLVAFCLLFGCLVGPAAPSAVP